MVRPARRGGKHPTFWFPPQADAIQQLGIECGAWTACYEVFWDEISPQDPGTKNRNPGDPAHRFDM